MPNLLSYFFGSSPSFSEQARSYCQSEQSLEDDKRWCFKGSIYECTEAIKYENNHFILPIHHFQDFVLAALRKFLRTENTLNDEKLCQAAMEFKAKIDSSKNAEEIMTIIHFTASKGPIKLWNALRTIIPEIMKAFDPCKNLQRALSAEHKDDLENGRKIWLNERDNVEKKLAFFQELHHELETTGNTTKDLWSLGFDLYRECSNYISDRQILESRKNLETIRKTHETIRKELEKITNKSNEQSRQLDEMILALSTVMENKANERTRMLDAKVDEMISALFPANLQPSQLRTPPETSRPESKHALDPEPKTDLTTTESPKLSKLLETITKLTAEKENINSQIQEWNRLINYSNLKSNYIDTWIRHQTHPTTLRKINPAIVAVTDNNTTSYLTNNSL